MAINEDALDDLPDDSILEKDVVIPPNSIEPEKEKITLISQNDTNQTLKTELTDKDRKILPELDVDIVTIEDKIVKITNLEDVESAITNKEVISKADAERINVAFENFLSSELNINSYTLYPTKTNYARTVDTMRRIISTEQDEVITKTKSTIIHGKEALVEEGNALIEAFENLRLDVLRAQSSVDFVLENNKAFIRELVFHVSGTKRFISLTTSDLSSDQTLDDLKNVDVDLGKIKGHLKGLNALASDNLFKIIYKATEGEGKLDDVDDIFDRKKAYKPADVSVTLQGLFERYSNERFAEALELIIDEVRDELIKLEDYSQSLNGSEVDYQNIVEWQSNHFSDIRNTTKVMNHSRQVIIAMKIMTEIVLDIHRELIRLMSVED